MVENIICILVGTVIGIVVGYMIGWAKCEKNLIQPIEDRINDIKSKFKKAEVQMGKTNTNKNSQFEGKMTNIKCYRKPLTAAQLEFCMESKLYEKR